MEKPLKGLLRAKGYVWLASRPEWVASYSRAGNNATIEPVGQWWSAVPKSRWPAKGTPARTGIETIWQEPYGDRLTEVVFIGQGMDREQIEQEWKRCHLSFTEARKGMAHWRDLDDPFPNWARTNEVVEAA